MSDGVASDHVTKLRELVRHIEIAMLTTLDDEHKLRSRPMAAQEMSDDGTLWFFTSADAAKVHESENGSVNVALSDPKTNTYVSISGRAELVKDRSKINDLWKPSLKVWFPNGPDDPNVALLRVTPNGAEYWDAPSRSLVHLFGYAKAALTGRPPSDIGDHAKVEL